jgi:hypothetical protein
MAFWSSQFLAASVPGNAAMLVSLDRKLDLGIGGLDHAFLAGCLRLSEILINPKLAFE